MNNEPHLSHEIKYNSPCFSTQILFWYLLNVLPIIIDGLLAVASQTSQTRGRRIIHELDEESPFPAQWVFQQTLQLPSEWLLKAEGCWLSLWCAMTISDGPEGGGGWVMFCVP